MNEPDRTFRNCYEHSLIRLRICHDESMRISFQGNIYENIDHGRRLFHAACTGNGTCLHGSGFGIAASALLRTRQVHGRNEDVVRQVSRNHRQGLHRVPLTSRLPKSGFLKVHIGGYFTRRLWKNVINEQADFSGMDGMLSVSRKSCEPKAGGGAGSLR